MKFALIKNIPLAILLRKDGCLKIDWTGYGFDVANWSNNYMNGKVANGDHSSILPIKDESVFNSHLSYLQGVISSNSYPNDSIEVIDEAQAQLVRDDIIATREAS